MLNPILISLASLAWHETGHAVATYCAGLRVTGVVINARGLGIKRTPGNARQSLLIASAGPVASLLLACLGHAWLLPNILYTLVNVLPLPGSDGCNALSAWRKL